jgi:YHS domain-containing protein
MLLRLVLFIVFAILVARAFWRLVDGIADGVRGGPRRGRNVPSRGVQMVRDPVCGTFVLPDRALTLTDGRERVFFCSAACRDKYHRSPNGQARSA